MPKINRLVSPITGKEVFPGSISHGTMRPEDLIPAFRRELARLDALAEASIAPATCDCDPDTDYPGNCETVHLDDRDEELSELFDALDRQAPLGFYFGAHVGDGSDYGFWPLSDL